MSQISKVDKILEEIYLEMEMEEIDELLAESEEDEAQWLLSEEGAAGMGNAISAAQQTALAALERAKKAKNPELIKSITQKINMLKFKYSRWKASSGASDVITTVKKGAEKAGEKVSQAASATGKAIKGGAEKVMSTDAGKTVAKGVKGAVEKGSELAGQAKGMVAANPTAAAAAAAVAAVAAGVVIYKKFLSQSARACKGKSGSDKSNCVSSFKVKGLQAAKAKVASGMSKCKDAKCKAKLQSKIQGFDAKISAMKGKVSESIMNKYIADYISELKEARSKN